MASNDLDNPSCSSPVISPATPSSPLDCSYPTFPPTDNRGYLSRPNLNHKTPRNCLDPLGSPTHPFENPPLPPAPFPTLTAHSLASGSILWENSAHDDDPEEHDKSCSSHPHGQKDGIASLIQKLMHRVRRPSPSPIRKTDAGSNTTRNNGQRGDNGDVKCKGAELAPPAENESPSFALRLPPSSTDSSCLSRPSPPSFNFIPEPPPIPPTPTDPIPAESQGSQNRIWVGSKRSSTHSGSQT